MSTYAGNFLKNGVLTGIVQAFVPSANLIGTGFFDTKKTPSDNYSFDVTSSSQGILDFRNPDAPAGVSSLLDRKRVKVNLTTLREKRPLPESVLRWWDAPGKFAQASAEEAISKEFEDLSAMFDRTWEYAIWKQLTTGAVTLTGEDTTVYTMGTIGSATASPTWATIASSDPINDLLTWKQTVEQSSGLPATDVYLSSQAIKYIFQSTKALLILGQGVKDTYASTGQVAELAGMKVHVMDAGYKVAGSFKYHLSTDGTAGNMCVIKCAGSVGQFVNGLAVDSRAPLGFVGKFAKSWIDEDPAGRHILLTQTAMPGLTNCERVFAGTLW